MQPRKTLTRQQKLFAMLCASQVHFMRFFWKDMLSLPPSTRQKTFWSDASERVMLATGRKTGKTIYLEARIVRHAITYTGEHMSERMVVTPGDNQMTPIQDRLLTRINMNPLFRLLKGGPNRNWNKNEGLLTFGRIKWYFRIDGSSGTDANMVGLRLDEIIGDEMQLTIKVTHRSRQQSALPDCKWLYCGVPNGVRHTPFWEIDQSEAGIDWKHYKFSTYANPLYWDVKRRDQLRQDYTEGSQDYITLVMGGWGEEVFSSFPPGSLAIDELLPYRIAALQASEIPFDLDMTALARISAKIQLPRVDALRYVIGMDYGMLQDPSELGIFYQQRKGDDETDYDGNTINVTWRMLGRIQIEGASPQAQARVLQCVAWILVERLIAVVCLDQAHAGIAVATELLESEQRAWWANVMIDANSGGTIEVDVAARRREELEEAGGQIVQVIKKVRRKQYATQQLQGALLAAKANLPNAALRLWLGKDDELIQELIDTREKKSEAGNIIYIPRSAAAHRPVDHNTDMLRDGVMAALEAKNRDESEGDSADDGTGWTEHPLFATKTVEVKYRAPWG